MPTENNLPQGHRLDLPTPIEACTRRSNTERPSTGRPSTGRGSELGASMLLLALLAWGPWSRGTWCKSTPHEALSFSESSLGLASGSPSGRALRRAHGADHTTLSPRTVSAHLTVDSSSSTITPALADHRSGASSAHRAVIAWMNGTLLDLNHAPAEAMAMLPGMGNARALAIVRHRERHGCFADIQELQDVRGIGEKTLKRLTIRAHILPCRGGAARH